MVVVLDIYIPELLNNKLFQAVEAVKVSHTLLPICYFAERAEKAGHSLMTPDVFLALDNKPKDAVLISHLTSPFSARLVAAGAKPLLVFCQESPFVATRFYAGLRGITKKFKHAILFAGMRRRVSARTQFQTMYFPVPYGLENYMPKNFSQKKLACLVSSAKSNNKIIKKILLNFLYGPGISEVNSLRRQVVRVGAGYEGFDLFGFGWSSADFPDLSKDAVVKTYRGSLPYAEKKATIGNYKFNFCFENSVFPGYVTEKILDALAAGTVPVYFGAPDIAEFVPKEAFIDARDFKTTEELFIFLSQMPEKVYTTYINNIKLFFVSEKFEKFSQEHFAEVLLKVLEEG